MLIYLRTDARFVIKGSYVIFKVILDDEEACVILFQREYFSRI